MENKTLAKSTLMIATFLLTIPFAVPAFATPMANVSVSPGSVSADFGQSFTASVMVSNAADIAGYELRFQYDPNVLTATSVSLAGTLFDPAKVVGSPACSASFIQLNGPFASCVDEARSDIVPALGLIREVVAIKGGTAVLCSSFCGTSASSGSILNINFQVNDPASPAGAQATASEYPSSIGFSGRLSRISLLTLAGGVHEIPANTSSATYTIPADIGLRSVGCRAANNGFNTNAKGFNDPLFCRVVNNGSITITGSGTFNIASLGGVTESITGSTLTLGPGGTAQVDATLTVAPHTNDVFFITGQGTRIVTFQDGSMLSIPNTTPFNGVTGGSLVFQVNVISPF